MRISRIFGFIFALSLFSSVSLPSFAQSAGEASADTVSRQGQVRGIQYTPDESELLESLKPIPLFAGVSVSGDVAGAVMAVVSPYGQYEAACRVNLRGRFFPIFEAGWGLSDHTDESTELHYKTGAPYFRIGCDYNFARNRRSGNRILGGLRYGFSSFKYDVDGPDIVDNVWGTTTPFHFEGLKGNVHWCEVSFGLEAKIWSIFHLGWTVRYRLRLSNKTSDVGDPWYVPGYGKNDTHALSGTFNVIFDI